MFELFHDEIGKCVEPENCLPLIRNNAWRNGQGSKDNESEETKYIADEEDVKVERYRPLKSTERNIVGNINYLNKNGTQILGKDRVVLSHLDKWHSFLFHSVVTQKQMIHEEKKYEDTDEETDDEDIALDTNISFDYSNRFVTDATEFERLAAELNSLNTEKDNLQEKYYEYQFGVQILYHTLQSHFVCMKHELLSNEIHTVLETVWDDTLSKALTYLQMQSVQDNYRANNVGHARSNKYGITMGELIGVDNIIAILFYCNFDTLQQQFRKTFRKINPYDSDEDIVQRHVRNFFWIGRALYVAVNYFGKRMNKNSVVWRCFSSKILFANFAIYFDHPTLTTTRQTIAKKCCNSEGIILKLKSKYNRNCAWMLDVSLFSDCTDYCEKLFLNETLIIADILTSKNKKWTSHGKYMQSCLYFNKITTGNAVDLEWNIKATQLIQNTLAKIIIDSLINTYNENNTSTQKIPDCIRVLFKHYCYKMERPRFNDV
eukprot:279990_1